MLDTTTIFTESPLGTLAITGKPLGITAVEFVAGDAPSTAPPETFFIDQPDDVPAVLRQCVAELKAYFAGTRRVFSVPLILEGTDFQLRVWDTLLEIPFGQTRTYAEIARALGDEKSVRAVGTANAQNPVAVIVPCHRVIGSDGALTGYAGGLWRKEWLLAHEGTPVQQRLF